MGSWQHPPGRPRLPGVLDDHRVPGPTDVIPVVGAPGRARPGIRWPRPSRSHGDRGRAPTPWWRRPRYLLIGAAAALVLGPVLLLAIGFLVFSVPNPDEAVNNQVATVSFLDGEQLTRLVPEEGNRTKVPIEQVPLHVRHAVLSAEDRSFYSNPGFDVTGILRAVWSQLRGGVGGGSTITQQFVKKALVGDEQTLWRKYKEVILAIKISQERSKDQILSDYLNTIYFGRGAYGIQSAAQSYFGKNVQDLTPSEGALLAAVIQSPSRWDPAVNPEHSVDRWNFVLDGMVAEGWLEPPDRQAAQFPHTVPRKTASGGVPSDNRGHIVSAVKAELESLGISEEDLAQEGLRITTTIDPRRQEQAVTAAHDVLSGQPVNLRSAMVAIDPQTGGVLAYYGGDNGLGLDYTKVRRLAGSTFKPFVVLAGLQRDPPVGLGERFDGEELPGLRNAEGADCDQCDLKQAMTVSNNVVFTTLAKRVGPEAVAAAARSAGITAPIDDPTEGIALGNKEVSPIELASAYATIAAGGVWRQPHLVTSVVTADDRVLYQAATDGERRFPERVARNVAESMMDVAAHDDLSLPGGRPVAAKTGTVQSRFEGQNNDAWMAGFTPSIASAVWMGTDMNSPIRTARGTPIEGATLPGEVWHQFMAEALDDEPVEPFAPFRPIGEAPSTAEPGAATSTPPTSESGAPPTPTGVAPSGTAPSPPGEEDESPGEGLFGGPEPAPEPDPRAAPDATSPPPRAGLLFQREPAESGTAPDCSASACDESSR
ncbi:transglycosylase domain-containing protein [Pseudonocardia yunnanensis]|uniref:Transglycosylase domain-containing protein n=1 Tax=Pseudonocardia yunnanensis TaxID=58107 RepID=A0ABW4FDS5_9PSEU